MAGHDDLLRRGRNRDSEVRSSLAAVQTPLGQSMGAAVCKTVAITSYPTAPNVYYGVAPLTMKGAVTEGAPVDYDVSATPFPAAHLGSVAPPEGTVVLVRRVANAFVFVYNG